MPSTSERSANDNNINNNKSGGSSSTSAGTISSRWYRQPSANRTYVRTRLDCQALKLQSRYRCGKSTDDLSAAKAATASNPWITGGPLGSKNAVLVFRTSALANLNDLSPEVEHSQLKPLKCIPNPNHIEVKDQRRSSDAGRSRCKLPPANFNVYKKRQRNHPNDSLSSSEHSMSSAGDGEHGDGECEPVEVGRRRPMNSSADVFGNVSSSSSTEDHNASSFAGDDGDDDTYISDMPAAVLKLTYKFTNTETKLLRRILSSHGLKEANESQHFNLLWTGLHMKPDILRNLTPYQRINHFPRSYELTRKDRLYKNIEKMQHLRGIKNFDIVPLSFMLPMEYRDLVSAHRSGHRGPWIVKPAASSRGRGIYLVNSPEQIPSDDQVIVSKYIADPLCIDGHKCDVRLYVAVTSFDPLLIYLYEDGIVRLATVKYDKTAENLWNPCMHLCNYSINKYHSDYIKATEMDEDVGHKWTFSALLRHLKSQGSNIDELMLNIEDVIVKSIFSCSQSIVSAVRMFVPFTNNCFELYGFDILIDNTLKPWLLEVNLSPSLGVDTPLDAKVKSALLTDLLTLAGLPALSPLSRVACDSKWNRLKSSTAVGVLSTRKSMNDMSAAANATTKRSMMSGLSAEEARIVRNARAQYARRGGFVRIFPTADSMHRYGAFLDPVTGIAVSISNSAGTGPCSMILPHNYNQMLHGQLFGGNGQRKEGDLCARMAQYERTLSNKHSDYVYRSTPPRCMDEARRLRRNMRRLMEEGNELTTLQARRAFAQYLECLLRRLSNEPKSLHERLILKFITRADLNIKMPVFMKNPYGARVDAKDRSAMVAKLLGDYVEAFGRDTDGLVDNYDYYGMIPMSVFDDFMANAQEADLESVMALHVNLTQNLSFLFNRGGGCGGMAPAAPPIPTGANGFLKALPLMAPNIVSRDAVRIDAYYKSLNAAGDKDDERFERGGSNPRLNSLQPLKRRSNIT